MNQLSQVAVSFFLAMLAACSATPGHPEPNDGPARAVFAETPTPAELRRTAAKDMVLGAALRRFEDGQRAFEAHDLEFARKEIVAAIGDLLLATEHGITPARVGMLQLLASIGGDLGLETADSAIQRIEFVRVFGLGPYNSLDAAPLHRSARRYLASLPREFRAMELETEFRQKELPSDVPPLVGAGDLSDPDPRSAQVDVNRDIVERSEKLLDSDRFSEAESELRSVITNPSAEPSLLVQAWMAIADARFGQGDERGAADALAAAETKLTGADPSLRLRWLAARAVQLVAESKFSAAAGFEAQIVELVEGNPDRRSEGQRARLRELGLLAAQGDIEAVQRVETSLIHELDGDVEADAAELLRIRRGHASTLARSKRLQEAAAVELEVLTATSAAGLPGSESGHQRRRAARRALIAGDPKTACDLYGAEIDRADREPGSRPDRESRAGMARALLELGRAREAEAVLTELLPEIERDRPPGHPEVVDVRSDLAAARAANGRDEEAQALRRRNLQELEERLPDGHPDVEHARHDLERISRRGDDAGRLSRRNATSDVRELETQAQRLRGECRLEEALRVRRSILDRLQDFDPEDPRVDESRREVAALLRVLGRAEDARVLEDRFQSGVRIVEAGSNLTSNSRFVPGLRIEAASRATGRLQTLEVHLDAPRGLGEIVVRQDGVLVDPAVVEKGLQPEASGRAAVLRLDVEIPAGSLQTLLTVAASDRTGSWTRDEVAVLTVAGS